jgi:hypothetical protein
MPTKTCTTCGQTKAIDQFPIKKAGRFGVAAQCKPCRADWARRHYAEHAEDERAKKRAFHAANRDTLNARFAVSRRKKYAEDADYRTKRNAQIRDRLREVRALVFAHYGAGDPPSCVCCGESHDEFLQLDHVNGGGNIHRATAGSRGTNGVFYWLIRNGFPDGYRLLCANCHQSLGRRGYCPHQRE